MGEETKPGFDAMAMRVDDVLWAWVDDAGVFFRMAPKSVPDHALSEPDETDLEILRSLTASRKNWGPPLPVKRGIVTKIGSVAFPSNDLLRVIEHLHGKVTWHIAQRWFAARSAVGEVVAAMMLPKEDHAMNVRPLLVDGEVWMIEEHFGFRPRVIGDMATRAREDAAKSAALNPRIVTQVENLLARAAGAAEVSMVLDGDEAAIGASRVPFLQAQIVAAAIQTSFEALRWRWLGARDPVVAFHEGKPVGFVMPVFHESARGGEA